MPTLPVLSPKFIPISLLFMIGGLWGFFFVLIKTTVSNGISPTAYVFWFCLGAGLVVLLIGLIRRTFPPLTRPHIVYYFKAALLRFTLANIILYTVTGKLPVGIMAVIMAFTPIVTHLISLVTKTEKFLKMRFLGILLGFAGVLMIVIPEASLPDPSLAIWVLIGFGTPVLHGAGYVFLSEENRPADIDSLQLAAGTLISAALMALPISLLLGDFSMLVPPFSKGEIAMMTHFILAGINFYAIFELIRLAGPTYMSQALFLSVIFGVFFGILIFREEHSLFVWLAIALILSGLSMVNAWRR